MKDVCAGVPVCSSLRQRKEEHMERTSREACNISPAGLMTPRDAAVYIGVKINTLAVWRMTNKYGLPFVKLGKVVRYRKADLDEWINKNVSTDRAD